MNQKTGAFFCKKRERFPARFKMKWLPRMAWASAAGRQLVGSWSAAGRQLVGSCKRQTKKKPWTMPGRAG